MATELQQEALPADAELKARHRAMWASGDYPSMVETFLLPLGPRLVEACGIVPGMHVPPRSTGVTPIVSTDTVIITLPFALNAMPV